MGESTVYSAVFPIALTHSKETAASYFRRHVLGGQDGVSGFEALAQALGLPVHSLKAQLLVHAKVYGAKLLDGLEEDEFRTLIRAFSLQAERGHGCGPLGPGCGLLLRRHTLPIEARRFLLLDLRTFHGSRRDRAGHNRDAA